MGSTRKFSDLLVLLELGSLIPDAGQLLKIEDTSTTVIKFRCYKRERLLLQKTMVISGGRIA